MKAVDVIVLLLVAAAVVAAVIHSIRARRKRGGGCGCGGGRGCGCDRCSATCKTMERKTQEAQKPQQKQPPSHDDMDEQSPHGRSPR